MSIEEQVKRLLVVTSRLSVLVQQENVILARNGRPDGLKEILTEKQALSGSYEQQAKILTDEEGMKELDPALRLRLREALEIFNALLAENRTRLNAKMEATKRIFSVIADAARENQPGVVGYGRSGAPAGPSRQAYAPALSVGMNQEL